MLLSEAWRAVLFGLFAGFGASFGLAIGGWIISRLKRP